jgi:hypothetical protein
MVMPPPPQVVTRHVDGQIRAYDLGSGDLGPLAPAAVFRPLDGHEPEESAVSVDLRRIVYTTLNSVVCLTRTGDLAWTSALEPHSDQPYGHRPGCAFAPDGRTVWVYRPDAMAGRECSDQWGAYDAESGAVVAATDLETVGHSGIQLAHPTDGSMYLDVGEGQDGSVIVRSVLPADGGEPDFAAYPWNDRCLIALSPGGEQFMTVDHGQEDVVFHRHPDGEAMLTLPVEAFGYDPDGVFVEWGGGYLTPQTAVVTLGGEDEDGEEWFRYHLVDLRTGSVDGELAVEAEDPYRLHLLGDGTWLTSDPAGHPVRWSRPVPVR